MSQYQVIQDYTRVYPDPIQFEEGEAILRAQQDPEQLGWWWCTDKRGKSGWVHEAYFVEDDHRFVATADYSALELNANAGDEVRGHGEVGGWVLATHANSETGWLPLSHVQVI